MDCPWLHDTRQPAPCAPVYGALWRVSPSPCGCRWPSPSGVNASMTWTVIGRDPLVSRAAACAGAWDLLSLLRGACEGLRAPARPRPQSLLCGRAPQCTDTEKRVQAYPPTRGNFSISARGFLLRKIFWNHAGTGVPGTSVMEKVSPFHPCTSGQLGRVSPPPHTWYCSTYCAMFFPLLSSAVLSCMALAEHNPTKRVSAMQRHTS
jgi:hypothetical protein